MDIGEVIEVIEIEPAQDPVPGRDEPAAPEPSEPVTPRPVEPVPVGGAR